MGYPSILIFAYVRSWGPILLQILAFLRFLTVTSKFRSVKGCLFRAQVGFWSLRFGSAEIQGLRKRARIESERFSRALSLAFRVWGLGCMIGVAHLLRAPGSCECQSSRFTIQAKDGQSTAQSFQKS